MFVRRTTKLTCGAVNNPNNAMRKKPNKQATARAVTVQRVVGHAHRYCQICGDSDCTGLRHCSPSDPYYERLRDPRDKEIARLADIIKRATTRFFVDGSDGETAAAMLKILQEASVPNARGDT